jgi:hypothetical protein
MKKGFHLKLTKWISKLSNCVDIPVFGTSFLFVTSRKECYLLVGQTDYLPISQMDTLKVISKEKRRSRNCTKDSMVQIDLEFACSPL